jgi:hypothetical protein
VTFLTPIPALIAAAITVPVLLALYLLKLRRRPLRVASTLFWPRASEDAQVNVPLRWLRPSWLLLLHLLALACLLVAFARPAVDEGGQAAGQRVVLLMDVSASMGAVDGFGGSAAAAGANSANASGASEEMETRLDRARERAKELVRDLRAGERREIAVVSFAGGAQPLSGFTASRSMLDAAIDSAAQTDQAADLPAALTFVESLLASGAEGDAVDATGADGATVILLSDGSFAPSEEPLESTLRLRFERIGPALPRADEPQSTPRADNIGIVGFAARRDDVNPALVRVFARLANANPQAIDVPLTLAIEGQAATRRAVRVAGTGTNSAAASDAGDAPGQEQVLFEVPTSPRGVLTLTIDRDDALASDNVASLVLPELFQPKVVVVGPDDAADGASSAASTATANAAAPPSAAGFDWLVTDVLEELSQRVVRRVGIGAHESGVEGGSDEPADLTVFLAGATPSRSPRTPSLSFAGQAGLGAFQVDPAIPTLSPRAGSIFWERTHPLMIGVPLDNLIVRSTAAWRSRERNSGDIEGPAATVLARADDTPLIALVEPRTGGAGGVEHVVVGFDLVDTNWPLQPSFAVFLANVVDRLTPRARSFVGQAFTTNQPVRVRAAGAGRVTLDGPVSLIIREPRSSGTAAASATASTEELDAGVLPRAGLYVVRGGSGGAGDRAVAVNVADLTESATLAPTEVRVGTRAVAQFEQARVPRELWIWFVLAAGVLLTIEWFVYGWQVRK